MYFSNRQQAGELLVPRLKKYQKDSNAIVLGLPRGGVVTAFVIAKNLQLPLDVICLRKIGAPYNPELAIGAVSTTGEGFFNQDLIDQLGVPDEYIRLTVQKETQKARQRLQLYRQNRPEVSLQDKNVILVDDGLATGATMKAAIQSVKSSGAARVIVAVPVSPPDTLQEIEAEVDEIVCLDAPLFFSAVGQFYDDFSQTEDEEVIELLRKASASK